MYSKYLLPFTWWNTKENVDVKEVKKYETYIYDISHLIFITTKFCKRCNDSR